jgi:UDP-N-acetylmuramate: L-alanyl-gamma-D-glutamyl-meso-diaminopimelate ligase
MGALAGLLQAAGHQVRGSDHAVYPPMSEQLAALEIPVFEGFDPGNLEWGPDVVVVGNVCRKDHVEVLAAQERGLPLASLPQVIGEVFLAGHHSLVLAGTHGKTTTSSLLAQVLIDAGRDPGCFIGGVPIALGRGWRHGGGAEFVVEGDEYDSAFFDKESKFLHYRPRTAVLTSVELDHVDIFASMEEVRESFRKFVRLIPDDGLLVVNAQNPEAAAIATEAGCRIESYAVFEDEDEGAVEGTPVTWTASRLEYTKSGRCRFEVRRSGEPFGNFDTLLVGSHNAGNVVAACAVAASLGIAPDDIRRSISRFSGVRRRLELRGIAQGVTVIDDYAHHPTAVAETLRGLRRRFPGRQLVAVYEPRSATSRRKTFQREFTEALAHADAIVVGPLHDPSRIPRGERFDPERLALDLHRGGTPATHLPETDAIVAHLIDTVRPGEVIVILSSGSFDGLHEKLLRAFGDPIMPARAADMGAVRDLLRELELGPDDITEASASSFYILENENGFVGSVGLEVYDEDAILRSLAVKKEARGVGYGWMLADTVIDIARQRGVKRIYLLTATASDFFAAKHGFRVVDLSTVAPEVAESTTFAQRDERDVAMRLDL